MARYLLVAAIAFVAALGAVWVARTWLAPAPHADGQIHAILHERLTLDAAQEQRLDRLEQAFAVRRGALEAEMRADNARLAQAIAAEHGYGAQVAAAVDRSHDAMGRLQKETLKHVFAMRGVLRPD